MKSRADLGQDDQREAPKEGSANKRVHVQRLSPRGASKERFYTEGQIYRAAEELAGGLRKIVYAIQSDQGETDILEMLFSSNLGKRTFPQNEENHDAFGFFKGTAGNS